MVFNPTNEQRNALSARGKTLVAAAAGSGKTAVLVERIVKFIIDPENPVDADRFLVVTFTNAAAAEMKARIAKRIADEVRKNPASTRLRKQQFLLSKANICTIDSFCINLVREYFYELDVPFDFKVADSGVISQIESESFETVFNRRFDEQTPEFLKLIEFIGESDAETTLKDNVKKIYTYLRSLPFPKKYVDFVKQMYSGFDMQKSGWTKVIMTYILQSANNLKDNFNETLKLLETDEDLCAAYGPVYNSTMDSLQKACDFAECNDWDNLFKFCRNVKFDTARAPKGYADEEFKQLLKSQRDIVKKFLSSEIPMLMCADSQGTREDILAVAPGVELLLDMVMDFWDECDKLKKQKNCMDFADVEYAVLKLLLSKDGEQPSKIAKELSERFFEVMVDEYQDTNDLQNTIFNILSSDGKNLFMVGDIKQSIYSFRQANPANFLKLRESLPHYEPGLCQSKVIMSGNFRSAKPICDFVNYIFGKIMSHEVGDMEYAEDDRLVAKSDFPEKGNERVQLRVLECSEAEDDKNVCEARYIADYIKKAVENGDTITENGSERQVRYGDFAVLMRSGVAFPTFLNEFKKQNIPVWSDTKEGFFQSPEIITMLSLLKVIDNPSREVPLVSLMMSELYAFSADEIAQLRIKDKKMNLYSLLVSQKNLSEKIAGFIEKIQKYRDWSLSLPTDVLIRRIYDDTGYIYVCEMRENGIQARANLLLLAEYARSYESVSAKGLTRFLRYIDRVGNEKSVFSQASVSTETDDAVKIMTIHHSKGLQFPICILAQMTHKFNDTDLSASLQISEKLGIGMKIINPARKLKYSTMPCRAISVSNKQASMSEELRVLYVAMTRAQERLLMVFSMKNAYETIRKAALKSFAEGTERVDPINVLKADSFSSIILYAVLKTKTSQPLHDFARHETELIDADVEYSVFLDSADDEQEQDAAEKEALPADEATVEKLKERLSYSYPYSKINEIAAKQTASGISHKESELKYACTAVPLFLQKSKLTPAQKGTAMHKFMECADFAKAKGDVEGEIARLCEEGIIAGFEAESLDVDKLKMFFASKLFARMDKSKNIMREKRFMIEIAATELDESLGEEYSGETVVVQGVVDCAFEENGEICIVDYKTDRVNNVEELKEKYKKQLEIYKKAIEQTTGMRASGGELFSLYLGESLKLY